jgi:hypothetical protein
MKKESIAWLVKNNVKSFSPQVSIMLIEIAGDLASALKADKKVSLEVKRELKDYCVALLRVAQTGGEHQGAVINRLSELLGHPSPAWTKENTSEEGA